MRRRILIAAAVATVAVPAWAEITMTRMQESAGMATTTQGMTVKSRDGTLIAYEPPIAVKGSGRDTNWGHLIPRLEAALGRGDRREVTRIFFMEGVGLTPDVYEGMMKPPSGPGLEAIAPTLIYDSRIVDGAYLNQTWPNRYRTNKVPVLLLSGDKTFPFIPFAADALSRMLANSSRGTLRGQDHGPKPEAIAPAVRKFLGA